MCIIKFSNKSLHFVGQFFELSEKIKSWDKMRNGLDLPDHLKFCCIQLTDAIPKNWKESI